MKGIKNLILIGVVVLLMLISVIGFLANKNIEYKKELSKLNEEYAKIVTENSDLKENIDDLNENIYNLFEKKPYRIHITNNDTSITYQQDKFGWFDSYTKSTIY